MTPRLTAWIALPALLLLAGCSAEKLTLDITYGTDTATRSYHVSPEGVLEVSAGGGIVEGEKSSLLHGGQLTPDELARLKRVIQSSGFFLQDAPDEMGDALGPVMVVDIELGLWQNKMEIRGQYVRSVAKIAEELNKHLPEKLRLAIAQPTKPPPDQQLDW